MSDRGPSVAGAFWPVFPFVYRHTGSVVAISVAWLLASLPLFTVGPATLGAYAAIRSLRDEDTVDVRNVLSTVRRHALNVVLLGGIPILVGATSLLYLATFVSSGETVAGVLGVTGLYVTLHFAMVLIPTFVGLTRGHSLSTSIKTSYRWTIDRPSAALWMLVTTGLLLIASLVLMVTFPLVFPAIAAWFHTELLESIFEPDRKPRHPGETRPEAGGYRDVGEN